MAVKNTEKSTFRPIVTFFVRRLHNVEDDRYAIFVVISNDALVGVCCIT